MDVAEVRVGDGALPVQSRCCITPVKAPTHKVSQQVGKL